MAKSKKAQGTKGTTAAKTTPKVLSDKDKEKALQAKRERAKKRLEEINKVFPKLNQLVEDSHKLSMEIGKTADILWSGPCEKSDKTFELVLRDQFKYGQGKINLVKSSLLKYWIVKKFKVPISGDALDFLEDAALELIYKRKLKVDSESILASIRSRYNDCKKASFSRSKTKEVIDAIIHVHKQKSPRKPKTPKVQVVVKGKTDTQPLDPNPKVQNVNGYDLTAVNVMLADINLESVNEGNYGDFITVVSELQMVILAKKKAMFSKNLASVAVERLSTLLEESLNIKRWVQGKFNVFQPKQEKQAVNG